jgi:hypothetical protein
MKLVKLALISAFLLTSWQIPAEESEPYVSVHNLPFKPYFIEDGYWLLDLITRHEAPVFIDVGSAEGGAARFVAQNVPDGLKIYCVNDWLNPDPNAKLQFQRFLSNVKQEQTSHLITPIRMNSQEAAAGLNVAANVIYLNSNDEDRVYNDILVWSTHLTPNGTICGNNWSDVSIQIGVTRAASALDLSLHTNNNSWFLERGQ